MNHVLLEENEFSTEVRMGRLQVLPDAGAILQAGPNKQQLHAQRWSDA
jgi:hypothetical protein